MSTEYLRPMSVGKLLDRAFHIYRRHFKVMFLTAVAVLLPVAVVNAAVSFGDASTVAGAAKMGAALLLSLTLGIVAWVGVISAADEVVHGHLPSVDRALRRGLGTILPMLGLVIILYIASMIAMVPTIMVGALTIGGAALLPEGVIQWAGIALATILVVSVVIALTVWITPVMILTVPTLVAERTGPIKAIRRAFSLAKGGRWKTLGVALLAWMITFIPVLGVVTIFGWGMFVADPSNPQTFSTGQIFAQQITQFGMGALTTPLFGSILLLLYYDRRVRSEGYDVELASAGLSE